MKPKICLSLIEKDARNIIKEIKSNFEYFDVVELRLDEILMAKDAIGIIKEISPFLKEKELIICYKGDLDLIREIIDDIEVIDEGPNIYIDIPSSKKELISKAKQKGLEVILSYHDYEKTPGNSEILEKYVELASEDVFAVKLAYFAHSSSDMLRLLSVISSIDELGKEKKIIAVSMGEAGKESRIIGGDFGSCLTYASSRIKTAPGQFEIRELKRIIDKYYEK